MRAERDQKTLDTLQKKTHCQRNKQIVKPPMIISDLEKKKKKGRGIKRRWKVEKLLERLR